ncbi:hypothetical protein AZ54_05460 [Xanthomonas oryzae pv. oryzae PXO86]|nr:hypothetical protein AZ54_05460 [Xanthomonas oryzae pv. oryzae PXO86]
MGCLARRRGDHLRSECIGCGRLRIDRVAHHLGVDSDVLQRCKRMVRFF